MAGRRRKKMKLRHNRQVSKRQRGAQLPTELLEVIFSKLSSRDNIRASAVCKEWLAIAVSVRIANKPPWLMFFPKYGHLYEFYDPSRRKTYWLALPELYGCRICCSKDGWLLLYKPRTHSIFFCCPYTRKYINLPNLQLMNEILTFSAAPTSPSCILFTVKHVSPTVVTVSTCRPGKTQWTTVNYQNSVPFVSSISNKLVYCQGLFYCLSLTDWLGVYDPKKSTWAVDSVPPPENFIVEDWWEGKFVAEHNGDIFVIYTCTAINPVIYKLDQKNKVWVEMQTLGRMALFANFLSSHARTDLLGTMTNSVYFSKVRFYGKRCVSYSLTNERYYPRKQRYDWGEQDTFESVWIEPPEDLSTFL
ncbi:F-box/kelch-repeat protein At1g57790-like [Salvia hispanica]|uniref:F-box/kelch-repeat protein At1g57790-like n=1 Tax=Salvia hispanica TaxID=49212 RepID=UPI0020095EA0|nr:F-box/kelch-repeat protein At1g57790-like [Salvia hispanica]XP_047938035.1 F-box/kelch-repeat protein At1g57790-like [Salvia hispanica]